MRCKFRIAAHDQPRLLARVVQLFDQQRLSVHSLVFERLEDGVAIEIAVECEPAGTSRLTAKLYDQLAIHRVDLAADESDIDIDDLAAESRPSQSRA